VEAITYLRLHPSETAVLHAASRIFAAYMANNVANDVNEDEMMQKAILRAIKMAKLTDKLIQSDTEM